MANAYEPPKAEIEPALRLGRRPDWKSIAAGLAFLAYGGYLVRVVGEDCWVQSSRVFEPGNAQMAIAALVALIGGASLIARPWNGKGDG